MWNLRAAPAIGRDDTNLLRFFRRENDLARDGEEVAARHLESRGYRVLGRRVRTRTGEIDLLAEFGDLVVFVEVKTRRSTAFGQPAEAVDRHKIRKLMRAVEQLRRRPDLRGRPCRIDVVEVLWPRTGSPEITHLESAVESMA